MGEIVNAFYDSLEIMPTPRRVRYGGRLLPLVDLQSRTAEVSLIVGAHPAPAEIQAARELAEWIGGGRGCQVPIRSESDSSGNESVRIFIGTRDSHAGIDAVCRREKIVLTSARPGAEGYVIRFIPTGGATCVLCAGSDAAGAYYAVQSLKQLFMRRGTHGVLRVAAIDDWPTLRYRGMYVNDREDGKILSAMKYNHWDYVYTKHGYQWKKPAYDYRAALASLSRAASACAADFTPMVNPLWSEKWQYDGYPQKIKISSAADVNALWHTFEIALKNGSRSIILALDDRASLVGGPASGYILTDPDDRRRFGGLGSAHAWLAGDIYRRLRRRYPGCRLIVCPSYYVTPNTLIQAEGTDYLRALAKGLPLDVAIMWTGPGVRSLDMVPADLMHIRRLLGRKPLYWDNTVYGQHDPAYYLFDRYADHYPATFHSHLDGGMHVNWGLDVCHGHEAVAPFVRTMRACVAAWQAADYCWNPEAYNAERSLRRALRVVFGSALVRPLLAFRDAYAPLYDRYPCLRQDECKMPLIPEDYRDMRQGIRAVRASLDNLRSQGAGTELLADLEETFHAKMVARAARYDARYSVRKTLVQRVTDGLLFPAESFFGGLWIGYDQVEKAAMAIRGRDTAHACMRAVFYLRRLPRNDVLLSLRGKDKQQGVIRTPTPIRVTINGRVIYEGPSGFDVEMWLIKAHHVPKVCLRAGRNELRIANLAKTNDIGFQTVRLAWAKLTGGI